MAMPAPKRGRPPGSKNRPKELTGDATPAAGIFTPKRKLPEDPAELNSALSGHKILVGPLVSGISGALEMLGVTPLSAREHSEGTFAFAALAYQEGWELNAWLIVALWAGSIAATRGPEAVKNYREKKKASTAPASLARQVKEARDAEANTQSAPAQPEKQAA